MVGTMRQGLGLGLAAVCAAGLAIRRTWAQDTVVRALGTQDLHAAAAAVDRLADGIAQTSRGRVAIVIEPDAPDTAAVIAGLRTGAAKLGWIRVAEIVDLVPEVAALSVPFLFRDPQKALAILDEASLGPLLDDQIRKKGLEPLGYLNVGAQRLAAPPLSIPDLRGQRIVARPGRLRAIAFETLGMEFIAGTVAGAAGTTPLVELRTDDLAAAEIQGPLSVAEGSHAYDLVVLCLRRDGFRELAPDVREMLRSHAREATAWQRGGTTQLDAAGLAVLRQRGARLAPLPDEELRRGHEQVRAAVAKALTGADPSIVRTVLASADRRPRGARPW